MKKLHILIPSLVATFSMPLIGLVGCNKAGCNKDYGTIYLNNVIKGSVGNMVALASNKLTMVKGGIFKFSINMGE
ncbi:MAG: hypothetical protein MJ200_04840 [Mycoplasmoidaceae bacterium]|nr:hypothetical protein [Mycoplasmoidaceae bacterium]